MNKNGAILLILGLFAGFIAGFIVANRLNASEIATLRAQSTVQTQAANNAPRGPNDETLTPDEIDAKIAEADKNPTNFSYQKNLGISLYRYGAMKQDEMLIERSISILERANALDSKDFEVLVALGNAQFDVGFFRKDRSMFDKARTSYSGALAIKPRDADVWTDMGISYFVQEPPDNERAATELQKVLAAYPEHSRAMQFLVQVYAKQGKLPDAEKMLAKIIELSPTNPAITDLRLAISNAKAGR